jgi:hypothetical protein
MVYVCVCVCVCVCVFMYIYVGKVVPMLFLTEYAFLTSALDVGE